MTTKRLNWTGRRRITRDQVAISLQRSEGRTSFAADLRLASLDVPPGARVVVEAYRQAGFMRFEFGTVALLVPPHSTWLEEFDPPEGVLFRVKVLGSGESEGRILAEADQIRPVDPDDEESGRKALLPVRGEPLGDEIWRLHLEEGAQRPELVINSELGTHWKFIARDPHVLWLVYPQILREVMAAIYRMGLADPEDMDDWRSQWMRFASSLPGVGPVPAEGEEQEVIRLWIEGVTAAFCRVHRFREKHSSLFSSEAADQ